MDTEPSTNKPESRLEQDDFNAERDFWASYYECLRAINERMRDGGEGWEPKG